MKRKMQVLFSRASILGLSAALSMQIAGVAHAENNMAVIINGTTTNITDANYFIGNTGTNNSLQILNAGSATNTGNVNIGQNAGANNNFALVTDSNSLWTINGQFLVGSSGSGNSLIITNGGTVYNLATALVSGIGHVGSNNSVLVTGPNSVWTNAYQIRMANGTSTSQGNSLTISNGASVYTYLILVGLNGANNQVLITDGGRLFSTAGAGQANILGVNSATVTNNTVRITGDDSLWQIASGGRLIIGTDGVGGSLGSGRVLVDSDGTLEVNNITTGTGGTGSLTNSGGILQFTVASPTLRSLTANRIVVTNGTVSFRGITTASPLVGGTPFTNVTYFGNNTFRLNNSTNATGLTSYEFDSVANTSNPSNYQRLVLLNNSRWVSAYLTNGPGGAIKGGAGDVVEVTREFRIERSSNPNAEFDLASSTVLFSGGVHHTNFITGKDFGSGGTPDGFTAENFSYGVLRLNSLTDEVCFLSGDGSPSNALYVTWLDLMGMSNLVSNLHAPTNINLYYRADDPRNAYLGGDEFQLTDCSGTMAGGFLLPAVPEPSTLMLLALAACAMLRRRSQRRLHGYKSYIVT